MSTVYTPTAVALGDITLPTGADARTATSITAPLQAVADGVAYVDGLVSNEVALRQSIAAWNWLPKVVAAFDICKQRYNAATDRRDFYLSDSAVDDVFNVVTDYRDLPAGTTLTSDITAGQRMALGVSDFDVDGSGNIVVWGMGFDAFVEYNAGGSAWTKHTGVIGVDPDRASIACTPAGAWVMLSGSGGIGSSVFATSANRAAWTVRTAPSGMSTVDFATVAYGNGVMVAQGFDGTNVYFARSTDDGVTWGASTSFALGFTADAAGAHWPRPVYTGTAWVACVTDALGTASRIYSSTDNGATWALAVALTTPIRYLAALGTMVVGLVGSGRLAMSLDNGATWRAGGPLIDSPATVCGCDERLVAPGGGQVSVSVGYGYADLEHLT